MAGPELICFDLDLPFRRPEPFPQNSLLAARVALIGLSGSWGEEFCRGVFRAEFGEGRPIDEPTVIADILSQLHIESAPMLEAARTETNKAALRTQTTEAERLGIFGSPSFTNADGELFWGKMVLWSLTPTRQCGGPAAGLPRYLVEGIAVNDPYVLSITECNDAARGQSSKRSAHSLKRRTDVLTDVRAVHRQMDFCYLLASGNLELFDELQEHGELSDGSFLA